MYYNQQNNTITQNKNLLIKINLEINDIPKLRVVPKYK